MSSEEEDDGDSKSVSAFDVPEDGDNVDLSILGEFANSQNVNKPVNWRTIDSDIALAEEMQKAEAHLAPRGERGSKFNQVRHQLSLRGYQVRSHRTVQARFNQLIEELDNKKFRGKDFLNDKEEELKSLLKDMKDEMETMEKDKIKENIDPKEPSKEGQFLRDKSALLVLGEALQRVGGSKLVLGKDGQIMAETTEGGAPINVATLLLSDKKARKKKGGSELVQSLLDAAGQNAEDNKAIELRKLDLMIEQSKQQHELEMKKLEMEMADHREEMVERRVMHDLEIKKLEMEMADRREATRLRMLELEERLHHKNEK
jgi:hypothetical protein